MNPVFFDWGRRERGEGEGEGKWKGGRGGEGEGGGGEREGGRGRKLFTIKIIIVASYKNALVGGLSIIACSL